VHPVGSIIRIACKIYRSDFWPRQHYHCERYATVKI